MDNSDKFLNAYKEYETLLRDRNSEYKETEDNSESEVQERMRICRQMRNYLTHKNDPGFLEISDIQLNFINSLIYSEKLKSGTVNDMMLTPAAGTVKSSDTLKSVFRKMKKLSLDSIIVYDKDEGVKGVITIPSLIEALLNGKKTADKVKKNRDFVFIKDGFFLVDMKHPYPDIMCITKTGKKENRIKGVLYINNTGNYMK